MTTAKMRHCAYCGAKLGILKISEWERGDTCGVPECERDARETQQAERAEAHERLDEERGWR